MFGRRYRDEDERGIGVIAGGRALWGLVKLGVGVGMFSVIAGSILADATTDPGTGASKVAWYPTTSDRDAMRRAASAALTTDIPTGSIRLDPCQKR
jgi:hypothetical protein